MDSQFAEFEVRLDTKQRFATADERRRQVHRDITGFDRLNDIVLFAFVVEFEILLVERERSLGVIREVEVEFLAHFPLYARLDLLVKIEDVVVPRAYSKRRVVDILMLESEEQFR